MLQWKKFQFFDREPVKDAALIELMQKLPVNAVAAGRGFIVLGSTNGFLTVVDRDFKTRSFQAHEYGVTHTQQLLQRNILVSVGNDEEAVASTIKIWNFDKLDREGAISPSVAMSDDPSCFLFRHTISIEEYQTAEI
jgi:hypothetical protein